VRRFSILHPPLLSWFSAPLYRDVAANWKGTGFLYLFLLLAVCWALTLASAHRKIGALVETLGPALVEQVPRITIRSGRVSVEAPQPYTLRVPGMEEPLLVIDTTGGTRSLDETDARHLLTETQLHVRKSRGESRVYDLSQIAHFEVDRDSVRRWLDLFRRFCALFLYPFALAGSLAYRILQALLYAAIGVGFARLLRAELAYPALLRLTCVAVTPAVILDTARQLTGVSVRFWWPICFALAMAYLLYAIRANAGGPEEPLAAPGA
jgi:hypothetical protein